MLSVYFIDFSEKNVSKLYPFAQETKVLPQKCHNQ